MKSRFGYKCNLPSSHWASLPSSDAQVRVQIEWSLQVTSKSCMCCLLELCKYCATVKASSTAANVSPAWQCSKLSELACPTCISVLWQCVHSSSLRPGTHPLKHLCQQRWVIAVSAWLKFFPFCKIRQLILGWSGWFACCLGYFWVLAVLGFFKKKKFCFWPEILV